MVISVRATRGAYIWHFELRVEALSYTAKGLAGPDFCEGAREGELGGAVDRGSARVDRIGGQGCAELARRPSRPCCAGRPCFSCGSCGPRGPYCPFGASRPCGPRSPPLSSRPRGPRRAFGAGGPRRTEPSGAGGSRWPVNAIEIYVIHSTCKGALDIGDLINVHDASAGVVGVHAAFESHGIIPRVNDDNGVTRDVGKVSANGQRESSSLCRTRDHGCRSGGIVEGA